MEFSYNHLKHNKKHKIAWDDAVFIDRELHFMRRKMKESIYINALDPSDKRSKIMNLEVLQQTLAGTNLTAKLEEYYDCEKYVQMPFPEKWVCIFIVTVGLFVFFVSGEIIVDEDLSKHCTLIVLLKKTSIDVETLRK